MNVHSNLVSRVRERGRRENLGTRLPPYLGNKMDKDTCPYYRAEVSVLKLEVAWVAAAWK